jgi:L-lactate dehydrogenase complex protein LldE
VRVGLFIPCYIDAFFPEVGIATLELLEKLGIEVDYPLNQTCCGQPMANAGSQKDAAGVEALFVKNFSDFEFIVTPSGSCAHHVREHLDRSRKRQKSKRSGVIPTSSSNSCTT